MPIPPEPQPSPQRSLWRLLHLPVIGREEHRVLPLGHRLRIVMTALGLALVFSASTLSSPGDGLGLLRVSLRAGADRLVDLQADDGLWPRTVGGESDLATSGRPARALLAAHDVLGGRRHLAAAERAGRRLLAEVERDPRARTSTNLLFLAELAAATGKDAYRVPARSAWETRRQQHPDPARAARSFMGRGNPTAHPGEAWRNYLAWSSGDVVELARAVGDVEWANAFAVEVAESWAPKHDHGWWTLAAGRQLHSLARVPGPRARRLAGVEVGLLRQNEVRAGIAWNDTPYDTFAYTHATAAALQGLLICNDPEARLAAHEGLRYLARQQAHHGGWGATVFLLDRQASATSHEWIPDARLAVDETPELDAEMVLALALGLRSTGARGAVPGA